MPSEVFRLRPEAEYLAGSGRRPCRPSGPRIEGVRNLDSNASNLESRGK
jgi:hypothetical protein